MRIQVKLLVVSSFLLFTLSFCQAKKETIKVVGILHSKDSIKDQSGNSNSSDLGIDVFIICNAKTQGNGGIDEHGKFNVTLLTEIEEDANEIDGCYAKLQSNSGAPCHIQEPQAASVKVLSNGENGNEAVNIDNNSTVIKFSPLNCQSAFFWPFPNLTFLGSPPSPPEYTTPPSTPTPEDLPPASSPVQPPLPPSPQPSYDPPAPALPPPEIQSPSPPPTYQDPIESPSPPPTAVKIPSSPPPQAPPPLPVYRNPSSPPPSPAYNKPLPSPPLLTPPSATVPSRRRPSPIPKAPPIPRLPLTPSVPRKFFNPPDSSKAKPPHLV